MMGGLGYPLHDGGLGTLNNVIRSETQVMNGRERRKKVVLDEGFKVLGMNRIRNQNRR